MQILVSWKKEKYFKMSSVENFTQNVKRYGLHKQIAHGSVHGKTDNKTCTKRRISLHTLSLHINSLIRAFANRMYLLQSIDLTKRLVRRAKTRVNRRNCIFWLEHSLIVFNFDSRAAQTRITSVTFWSDPSLIVQYAPSSDSGLSKKLVDAQTDLSLCWSHVHCTLVRFVVRFIKPFIWDFKPRSTFLFDLAVTGTWKLTHSFELSLASIALVCVNCVFVWQTPFSHGLSYWFNASLIAEAPL